MELGSRDNKRKAEWALVDFDSLVPMVDVLTYGKAKYGPYNWKKGLPTTEICESLIRHLQAYLRGEDDDIESLLPHTGHILANAMFLSYMHMYRKDLDSRFIDSKKLDSPNKPLDIDKLIDAADELIEFGDSKEKAYGKGMLNVLAQLKFKSNNEHV